MDSLEILRPLLGFLMSLFGTIYVIPHSMRKLSEKGYIAKDMYKLDKPKIPTNAGLILLFVTYISILVTPLIFRVFSIFTGQKGEMDYNSINIIILMVVSIFTIYGLIDDLVDVGRKLKVLFPIFFTLPLAYTVNLDTIVLYYFGNIELSKSFFGVILYEDIIRFLAIPLYVMVVSNLVNMHSGYNGLQSGLSAILITALIVKSNLEGNFENIEISAFFLGSILGFLYFNYFPAKIFEGNIGSLLFGSLIGCMIVVQQEWFFGFFILIPHTFNFFLWIYWLIMMKTNPSHYLKEDGSHQKFAQVDEKGYIHVPFPLTLKWVANYYFNLTEPQSTWVAFSLTIMFCITGLIIF